MKILNNDFEKDLDLIESIRYEPHPAQEEFHKSTARFRILAAGRRFGKSQAAVNEAIEFSAIHRNSIIWLIAPTYAQAMIDWRMFKRFLPLDMVKESHITEKYLELTNGSTIWVKSGDSADTLRGEGIDFLIVDEAAMVKQDVWNEALRPALSDKQGKAVFISSPAGHNWFYELWTRGQDPQFPQYKSWVFPTSSNPFIPAEEIEEARNTLPELVFRQEYMSEFLQDIGAVFRGVEKCIRGSFQEPEPEHFYVMGCDLAKYSDFTVLTVIDKANGHVVAFDRFNQIDWNFQKQRVIALANKYNHAKIIIDSTGLGDPITEDIKRAGMNVQPYKFTNESKKQLVEGLSIAIEQQRISYPDIPELINELRIFGYKIGKTGTITYSAPSSFHDDCCVSLALAVSGYGMGVQANPHIMLFADEKEPAVKPGNECPLCHGTNIGEVTDDDHIRQYWVCGDCSYTW